MTLAPLTRVLLALAALNACALLAVEAAAVLRGDWGATVSVVMQRWANTLPGFRWAALALIVPLCVVILLACGHCLLGMGDDYGPLGRWLRGGDNERLIP